MSKAFYKKTIITLVLCTVVSLLLIYVGCGRGVVRADEIAEVQEEIDAQNQKLENIKNDLANSKNYLEELKNNRGNLYWQLSGVKQEVEKIQGQISENEIAIDKLDSEATSIKELLESRLVQKNSRVQSLYYQYKFPVVEFLMGVRSFNKLMRIWEYKENAIELDYETLASLNDQLQNLEKNLEETKFLKEELVAVNENLNSEIENLNAQIAGANSRISSEQQKQYSLSQQINAVEQKLGELTEKQKALIQAKIESASKEVRLVDGTALSASVPPSPFSDGFAVASYGGPHQVGMNQYGAKGRALDGQTAEQILDAYYANISIEKNYSTDIVITVDGNNGPPYNQEFDSVEYNIEEYLKHLFEMPSDWPAEALKAQAIAARTYALKTTQDGALTIEPNQSKQVVKLEMNAKSWQDAVDATSGWVIKNNDELITPWYCSTSGGYTKLPTDVGPPHFSGLYNPPWIKAIKDFGPNGAYDGPNYGDSSWYHMVWGGASDSWTCKNCLPPCYWRGDCQPWLTNLQTQDIFNVLLLRGVSGDEYNEHLSPVNWGDEVTWDESKVIAVLSDLGITPVGKISSILTYEDKGTGDTTTVVVQSENYSALDFSADDFKNVFYMRSPGTLIIRTSRFDFISGG